MKILIFLACIVLAPLLACSQAQSKGGLLGAGMKSIKSSTKDSTISISGGELLAATIYYETTSIEKIVAGFQISKSLKPTIDYIEAEVNLGFLINAKERVQFPVLGQLGYISYKEEDNSRFGTFGLGFSGGVRFYVTNKMSLNLSGGFSYLGVDKIDDQSYDNYLGTINFRKLDLKILFYL